MSWLWCSFWVLWAVALLMVLAYGWVIMFGAPYIPTLKKQRRQAIKLLALKPGQQFIDLGCGDGGLLIMAAQNGCQAVGYELNPFLAAIAWLRTRRFGKQVKIICGNFWHGDLGQADGVFVFLIGHHMQRLDDFITHQPHKALKVVSNAFAIPGRRPVKKQGSLLLYSYPADTIA